MKEILFLLFTAFAVSADSFALGVSVAFSPFFPTLKSRLHAVSVVIPVVFFMCVFLALAGTEISAALSDALNQTGGALLLAIGVYSAKEAAAFQKASAFLRPEKKPTALLLLGMGFGIGTDGSLACLSLVLSGYPVLSSVLAVVFFHFLLITAGIFLPSSGRKKTPVLQRLLPAALLVLLGTLRICGDF